MHSSGKGNCYTYVHQDYPEITIQKEKIDEIANLFQNRLKPNTILLKKL